MSQPIPKTLMLVLSTALILLSGSMTLSAAGEASCEPSFEDVLSLRNASDPVISPDGKSIAFTVRTTDWKANRYDTEIWLVQDGGKPFQLTRTSGGSSSSPEWSPDGLWIAFIADRGEKDQVFLIRPDGGEAQQATMAEDGVTSFKWSPDGRRIAFAVKEKIEGLEKREQQYGKFSVEDSGYQYTHLRVVEVQPDRWPSLEEICSSEGEISVEKDEVPGTLGAEMPVPDTLTTGTGFTVGSFEWSPDGTRIAFDHQRDPAIASHKSSDISVVDLASKKISALTSIPGADMEPKWSPDSKWILYNSTCGDTLSDYYRNEKLMKIPSEGGTPVRIGSAFDGFNSGAVWKGRFIYFLGWQGTKRHIFRIDPESDETSIFCDKPDVVWGFDISSDLSTLACSGHGPATLTEIYKTALKRVRPERVTMMSRQIADWKTGTSEVISWTSRDGTTIEGILHKPDGFDPHRKYPLLVVIHGGPTWIDYQVPVLGYVYPVTQWLAKGAVVLRPNYRGSIGYGEDFRSLNVRNLGVGDAWDVMSGVDHLVEQGFVDTDRMGAMGWSQGGYISAFLTTATNRFKAISVGAGISNWVTYYVSTDAHPFTRQYLKATPWEDPDIYAKTSPMTNITRATTPTLIQHGEFDRRVPIPNAYELYQGLQDLGVETRLIVYKDFGHGIMRPKERLAATWHNWQWFAKYLWDEEIEIP